MSNDMENNDVFISNGWLLPRMAIKKGKLGKYLAKVRVELVLSQAELAEILGVSVATISFIERRQKPITRNVADKFIAMMGLNEAEREEFLKLAIMNNAAIKIEKIQEELLGNNNDCGLKKGLIDE